jgi:hypothetical protein
MDLVMDLLIEDGEQHHEADADLVRKSVNGHERVHVYVYPRGTDVGETGINFVHENAKFKEVCLGPCGEDDPNREWQDNLTEAVKEGLDVLLEAIEHVNDKDRTKFLQRK